jgi:predicted GNAT superfamily acetyltransferase
MGHPLPSSSWDLAHRAAESAGVSIVPLISLEDAEGVGRVIDAVWGAQGLPRELIRAFQHAGSVLLGARADGDLVGFVLGFYGMAERLHLHSHMLATVPEWRDRGVGYALKVAQRAECLDHGVEEVRWTFDPLVARNARFNLVKLGAVGTRLLPGFYGEMGDKLNRGDRSDRFDVRWSLRSDRVERVLVRSAEDPAAGPLLLEAVGDPDAPEPKDTGMKPGPGAAVAIPPDHLALRMADPELGRRWRDACAAASRRCFEQGLVATWFSRDSTYLFEPPEQVE